MSPWPVVLVHGSRTSRSQWDLQLPGLRAAGHEVLTPDLPGHGTRRAEPFLLEAALTGIEDALAAAPGQGPVHLVGSSLGGLLAIAVAGRRPARLGSLTACGAAVRPSPLTARLYAALIAATDRLPGAGADADPRLLRLLLGADGARAYLRGGRADLETVGAALRAVGPLDPLRDLHRTQAPVTFLHGRFDQLRLHERSLTAAAAHGRLVVLPYGTHLVNLTRPGRYTADLLRVLSRAEDAARAARGSSAA